MKFIPTQRSPTANKITQTNGSKVNSTTNIVLKASLREFTYQKFVDYLEQQMVNAKDIDNFEVYHVLDFSSPIFDERGTGTIVQLRSEK